MNESFININININNLYLLIVCNFFIYSIWFVFITQVF